jgi:DNA replication and repair protein RecF
VTIHGLRNLRPTTLSFSPALNIFVGPNGAGKTSLLEALCVAATGRSFRTEQIRDVVQEEAQRLAINAVVTDDSLCRQQRVIVEGGSRQGFIDGKRIASMASYATHTPIVVFYPNDLELVTGPAATRRSLLDRIALYADPTTQACRMAYARALRHRQHLLDNSSGDAKALLAFEAILAEQGVHYADAHTKAAQNLRQHVHKTFDALRPEPLSLQTHFAGIDSLDPDAYRQELRERRIIDRQRGRATFGPHRDDLHLTLSGQSARHHASQGQQRLLALAIKLAELKCIQTERQSHPILLLDDVSSELDQPRTTRVFEWLRDNNSQAFLTTPRSDFLHALAQTNRERQHFSVNDGEIRCTP